MAFARRNQNSGLRAVHYDVVATIVNKLPEELRKPVADHFATEFNKRSASFDAYMWGRKTGGTPAPNSAKTSSSAKALI